MYVAKVTSIFGKTLADLFNYSESQSKGKEKRIFWNFFWEKVIGSLEIYA